MPACPWSCCLVSDIRCKRFPLSICVRHAKPSCHKVFLKMWSKLWNSISSVRFRQQKHSVRFRKRLLVWSWSLGRQSCVSSTTPLPPPPPFWNSVALSTIVGGTVPVRVQHWSVCNYIGVFWKPGASHKDTKGDLLRLYETSKGLMKCHNLKNWKWDWEYGRGQFV